MSCPFEHHDGAYVLGSLSPGDRRDFEEHLAGCDACSRAVRELAGLPGLLARVDPAVLEEAPARPPVPETLLPALVSSARRSRRRRSLLTAGVAAAVAALALVVPLWVAGLIGPEREVSAATPTSPPPAAVAMTTLGDAPVTAALVLDPVAWGTRLDLTCTYATNPDYPHLPPSTTYVLVVTTRDGHVEQVGTWSAREGRTMRVAAATAADRADIRSVEVRTPSGHTVLRLVA